MIWSISDSKTFKRCQRQWFYKNIVGNGVAKDPLRRRIYLLSKLQSVSAWRGQIVDDIISTFIVPAVISKRRITLEQAKARAHDLFERQLACARKHPLWEQNFSPSQLGSDFAAFHSMEYGGEIDEESVIQAAAEIDTALENLFAMEEIKQTLKSATLLMPQRPLIFSHSGVSVRAVPDLVVFFRDRPPIIVDWKVHVFGIYEAWLQLGVYALALTHCKPHNDFPPQIRGIQAEQIELIEVQLLKNRARRYSLSSEEIEATEAHIAGSATEILLAVDGKKSNQLSPEDFAVTGFGAVCQSCCFRSCCWGGIA